MKLKKDIYYNKLSNKIYLLDVEYNFKKLKQYQKSKDYINRSFNESLKFLT